MSKLRILKKNELDTYTLAVVQYMLMDIEKASRKTNPNLANYLVLIADILQGRIRMKMYRERYDNHMKQGKDIVPGYRKNANE